MAVAGLRALPARPATPSGQISHKAMLLLLLVPINFASFSGPAWTYKGFSNFPALYFGSNETGLESSAELKFIARHQLSGWGWQVEQCGDGRAQSGADGWCFGRHQQLDKRCFGTGARCTNLTFDESQASLRDAKLLQQVLSRSGGDTDAVFVYRQANLANWWYKVAGRDAFELHPEYFHAADNGQLCWRDGPFWDFTASGATEYWLNTTVAELCAQASSGAISAVFFDGVDDASAVNKRGVNQSGVPFTGNSNCSWGSYTKIATRAARLRMSQAQMAAFTQGALHLNRCGIWPIYSMGNAMDPKVSPLRGYPQTMEEELQPLLASGARWARFYEFWGWSAADYGIRSALNLTRLGVPLVMHAYPGRGGPDDITMAVAMFLIVQADHCYFGTSVGGKGFTPWDDPAWTWHAFYDQKPGRPLSNASYNFETKTWTRHFTNAVVTVDEQHNRANVTILDATGSELSQSSVAGAATRTQFVRELSQMDIDWSQKQMHTIEALRSG